jgi:hypothetical protein
MGAQLLDTGTGTVYNVYPQRVDGWRIHYSNVVLYISNLNYSIIKLILLIS